MRAKEKTTNQKAISRKKFVSSCVKCTAGLSLLAFPVINEVLAAKEDKTKEQILEELQEKVNQYMMKYGTCSQSSFCALNDQFELEGDDTIPALKPFAGGIAGKGETCGAVTGSVMALGYYFETKSKEKQIKSLKAVEYASRFFENFKKEFGSTRCSEVVEHQYKRKYDFNNAEDMKLFMAEAKTGKCTEVVQKAVAAAAEIILQRT